MQTFGLKRQLYSPVLFCWNLLLILLFFAVFSCSSGDNYYDNGDYTRRNSMQPSYNSGRQAPYQQYQGNYQQPQYYQQQNYYQQQYRAPNSRAYYNPYEFQQQPYQGSRAPSQNYGGQYQYDYDQYYVPPIQYYNNEQQNFEPSDLKS